MEDCKDVLVYNVKIDVTKSYDENGDLVVGDWSDLPHCSKVVNFSYSDLTEIELGVKSHVRVLTEVFNGED